jgi:hypothetical protein
MDAPSLPRKVAFWLLVGLASTALAEVPFPGTPFDLLALATVVGPIYLLHTVVLAGVVYRTDRVSFGSLYLAGAVLGLYEAYVTKVVWAPVGDPLGVVVAGVHPIETLSLVLFWHPLMAFALPIAAVELAATDSTRSLVPPLSGHRFARPLWVVGLASLAVFHGVLGGGPGATLLSTSAAVGVLLAALSAWRLTGGHRFSMAALLPAGRELWVLGAALAGLYLLWGAALRPAALPRGLVPHIVVLALYAVVVGLLVARLRADGDVPAGVPASFTWPRALAVAVAFTVASTVASLLLAPLATLVFVAYFTTSVLAGVGILVAVTVELVR